MLCETPGQPNHGPGEPRAGRLKKRNNYGLPGAAYQSTGEKLLEICREAELTERQRDVIRRTCDGWTDTEIALHLGLVSAADQVAKDPEVRRKALEKGRVLVHRTFVGAV